MKRPKSRPPRAGDPIIGIPAEELGAMAERVQYEGSPQHKDTPSEAGAPKPRSGAIVVEDAKARGQDAPDCVLCPRKWARRFRAATDLLRMGIKLGQIGHPIENGLPKYVWARDPSERDIVYEARRLSPSSNGYKAYPLTEAQVAALRIKIE
jgi:hypothetical protein